MRVDRVIKNYKKISDGRKIEEVYRDILKQYSDTSITASEVEFLIKNRRGTGYIPEKVGLTELEKKAYVSKCMRRKAAFTAASVVCTKKYELEEYNNLAFLLDYSGTEKADLENQNIARIMTGGTQKQKEEVFRERLKPLLQAKGIGLEWKMDDELLEGWDQLEPILYQYVVLDKIAEEAMKTGMKFAPETMQQMKEIHLRGKLPAQTILTRAGVIANPYYSLINDEDLRKLDGEILRNIKEDTIFVFRDYLEGVTALKSGFEPNIKDQMNRKLLQLGYKKPEDAVLVNIRGRKYTNEEAVGMLKTGRPVYVLGENRRLIQSLELAGPDGFLKPIANRKKDIDIKEYLSTAKIMVNKLVEEGKPLSEEGKKAARSYMATMVCFEKLMNERKLGNLRMWHAIGTDEKKFSKAVRHIYEDKRFQSLTREITTETLCDFINNQGEKRLNEKYTSMIVADNHKRAAKEICAL